jgi:hypothetical protein
MSQGISDDVVRLHGQGSTAKRSDVARDLLEDFDGVIQEA